MEKIGRLKPDDTDHSIRVIMDDQGEIGRISRERMNQIIAGVSPVMGSSDVGIELVVGDVMIRVYAWQVAVMLTRWPWKKAGVWVQPNEDSKPIEREICSEFGVTCFDDLSDDDLLELMRRYDNKDAA